MNGMKKPYERPEVVTYSASQVLAMLGPAKAIYGAGGGMSSSPNTLINGGSASPRDLGSI